MISESELRRLYITEQKSANDIAAMLAEKGISCSPETVRNWMGKFGIKTRSTGEARRLRLRSENLGPWKYADAIREAWKDRDMTLGEMCERLNLPTNARTLSGWGKMLGLPPRIVPKAGTPAADLPQIPAYRHRSLIGFPESPRLEMEFRRSVAAAQMERRWS